ncbi:hypothetical protein IPL85_02095 [Candidatus Saccharibacteria bacterium]|nr:MAG: hypothetical protein IPL85_02095 [Candidatus Saccharibacteria bacterium]
MSKIKNDNCTYRKNSSWNLIYENGLLILNAGADKIFAIEDTSSQVGKELVVLWDQEQISLDKLSPEAQEVAEQLKTAGILLNVIEQKQTFGISYYFLGSSDEQLSKRIENELGEKYKSVSSNADLLLIIRTNGKLVELTSSNYYKELAIPHLFIDLAYEHSISVGPLVFPRQSACISCLIGRVITYWGDAEPPTKPAIQHNSGLIAGVVGLEIKKILEQYDRELVNNTIAYDFENHKVRKSSVYKLPMCPVCGSSKIDNVGSIKLPWGQIG